MKHYIICINLHPLIICYLREILSISATGYNKYTIIQHKKKQIFKYDINCKHLSFVTNILSYLVYQNETNGKHKHRRE